MKIKLIAYLLIILLFQQMVEGQSVNYSIDKTLFSSDIYDEFSPAYYDNGIVFCSNRVTGLLSRSTSQNKGLFDIYYVDTANFSGWKDAKLFSKNLTTILNDGPVTFNRSKDTVYFSRNLYVSNKMSEISGPRNKLGIFSAEKLNDQWTKIKELRYNNEWYNVITPCLSFDSKKLYFASDKLGGYGGSDLYYCLWVTDHWENPVNLGPVINTPGNEAYPYVNQAGGIFFSSDGHPGKGGKDIFYSKMAGSSWLPPVPLNSPINSEFDDFGLIADSVMSEGYFSSKKDSTIDIFHFKTNYQQLFYCENQRINQYCFKFNDETNIPINENYLQLVWTFGDGSKATGQNIEHCFPGPGKYDVKLNVIDKRSGRIFFSKLSYNLELRDIEQPIITSSSSAMVGEAIKFDGFKSQFPDTKVIKVTWYLGDGVITTGENISHAYKEKGVFEVNMGLILMQEKTGIIFEACGSKQIHVFSDIQEKKSFDELSPKRVPVTNILDYDHAFIENKYSAGKDFGEDNVFHVEVLTSKSRLNPDNSAFANLPDKYSIKEIRLRSENIFSYVIAEEMSLMSTYSIFNEIVDLGFKDAKIRTYVLEDPAEKELNTLKKVFGVSADSYFLPNDFNLTSAGSQMLDLIMGFMAKYPAIKLEIATHTDNTGSPATNQLLSQKRAESMVNYLIINGVSSLRLIPMGFGGTKPLVPNMYESDRKLNRRVEFIIFR